MILLRWGDILTVETFQRNHLIGDQPWHKPFLVPEWRCGTNWGTVHRAISGGSVGVHSNPEDHLHLLSKQLLYQMENWGESSLEFCFLGSGSEWVRLSPQLWLLFHLDWITISSPCNLLNDNRRSRTTLAYPDPLFRMASGHLKSLSNHILCGKYKLCPECRSEFWPPYNVEIWTCIIRHL